MFAQQIKPNINADYEI